MKPKNRPRVLHEKGAWAYLRSKLRAAERILLNPRLLICLFIAWMITNGWSYVLFGVGMYRKINWMRMVAGTYLGFLWLPFTPEKILTVLLAIALQRLLFPNDERTLGVLCGKWKQFRGRKNGSDTSAAD